MIVIITGDEAVMALVTRSSACHKNMKAPIITSYDDVVFLQMSDSPTITIPAILAIGSSFLKAC